MCISARRASNARRTTLATVSAAAKINTAASAGPHKADRVHESLNPAPVVPHVGDARHFRNAPGQRFDVGGIGVRQQPHFDGGRKRVLRRILRRGGQFPEIPLETPERLAFRHDFDGPHEAALPQRVIDAPSAAGA